MFKDLEIHTSSRTDFLDITGKIRDFIKTSDTKNGLCQIFIPHTTAAVTINENADPSVEKDILKELNKVIPFDDNYEHSEGNSAAHIKSSIIGPGITVIIRDGQLMLGTWQGIFFCEFDGPRRRKVWLKVIEG
jgi:secondary thiamine-phosphate synthase enzyme